MVFGGCYSGEVVRVAPNEVVFSTPQAALDIYNAAAMGRETWVKTDLMDFGTGDGGFIWEEDPIKRREVAKKIVPAFSTKAVRAKQATVHMYIDLFVDKMKEIGGKAEGVEITKWLLWLSVDMSADLTYGREMHQMRDEKNSVFLETLLGTNLLGTLMQVSKKFPLLSPLALLFTSPKLLKLLSKFSKLNSEEVQKRIDNRGMTKHPDFFDYMLPANSPAPTSKKQKVHLEQVAFQLFIAGFDPVQITFYGCLFFLVKEPSVYANLVGEIRTEFQSYSDITPESLVNLEYLQAFIQETFRMYYPGATGFPRRSPGATVDGIYVPKGLLRNHSQFALFPRPAQLPSRALVAKGPS
ncbi:hypothetical protein DL764_000857 [Monosporascus ibericus]|uniref:Cytochrome P450 n=1 Tax=Monosporascus ibericus TaxID=155417 RepID=A0A4Q4TVC4_9PEZI|nr:hypothetical protein DL764_000857 [Monosporascus ibericus]